MKSSTQTILSLNRQNKINNEIKKQKKEILDIVYTELRDIKRLDKEISKQIKIKTNHFKKTKKFDNIYQTIDTYIDNLILRKQNIEDNLNDFLQDNKDYTNYVNSRIQRIRPNSHPLSYGTPATFGGGKVRKVVKKLPDGNVYETYDDIDKKSPSIVKIFNSSSNSPESPQFVNKPINMNVNDEMIRLGYQDDLNPQEKPVIPTSFMKSRKKRRIRPLKNIGNVLGTRRKNKETY